MKNNKKKKLILENLNPMFPKIDKSYEFPVNSNIHDSRMKVHVSTDYEKFFDDKELVSALYHISQSLKVNELPIIINISIDHKVDSIDNISNLSKFSDNILILKNTIGVFLMGSTEIGTILNMIENKIVKELVSRIHYIDYSSNDVSIELNTFGYTENKTFSLSLEYSRIGVYSIIESGINPLSFMLGTDLLKYVTSEKIEDKQNLKEDIFIIDETRSKDYKNNKKDKFIRFRRHTNKYTKYLFNNLFLSIICMKMLMNEQE